MADMKDIKVLLAQLQVIKEEGALEGEEADRSENLHRLFMYPAMMVPSIQSAMIEAMTHILPARSRAIDPFMGSGTSILSCMEYGLDAFGQDINPFAVLLSKAKVTRYDLDGFRASFQSIKERIEKDDSKIIDVSFPNLDKWFNKDIQIELSKIRRAIQAEPCIDYRRFFWVVMSEAIRIGSNDRTSTFKLHVRSAVDLKDREINIVKEFFAFCKRGIDDLADYCKKLEEDHLLDGYIYSGESQIVWGNTQERIESKEKYDLLVSSPPYGDNHTTVTYGQTCYLPLQWIDPKDIDCPYNYLKTTQEIDRQSLGGRKDSKRIKQVLNSLLDRSPSFASFYRDIPDEKKDNYNKTIAFIADFDESLDAIVEVMKPDAFYIWTIGNRFVGGREVPNADVLKDLMEYRGISLFFDAERSIRNKKQAKRNRSSRTMEKERILVFHQSN